jgi:hypothetical protein
MAKLIDLVKFSGTVVGSRRSTDAGKLLFDFCFGSFRNEVIRTVAMEGIHGQFGSIEMESIKCQIFCFSMLQETLRDG